MPMKEFPSMFGFLVSHATHAPRGTKKDGVRYHFSEKSVMEKEVKDGKFLEFASDHGNLYGTNVEAIELAADAGKAWECAPGKELAWNLLSLFTTSGMLFLEVNLPAFLFQGKNASGLESLTRTFGISGKAVYLFGSEIPLFVESNDHTHQVKWNLLVVHKLLLTFVYGFILFMYRSKWKERLPASSAFYKYVTIMFILNAIALFASGITENGAALGFWLYRVAVVCCHAFYLPLPYTKFLADIFQEEDFHLENVYYSEMKDAGFFESD